MTYIISNKYRVIEQIGEGSFGKVFLGKHIRTDENIAIKIQFKSIVNVLQHEAKIYKELVDISGVPLLRNYGCDNGFHYLIIDNLDISLDKANIDKLECIKYFKKSVEIVRDIHKKNILHRDIKPDNFMIKERNGKRHLYIIDLGLAKRYIIEDRHIEEKQDKKIIGTVKYASINIHNGIESSRRDDIESLCYTYISLYGKNLPWAELCDNLKKDISGNDIYKDEIKEMKNSFDWLLDIPGEFLTILLYCKKLNFLDKPNYKYIINLLENLISIYKWDVDTRCLKV
ncbi:serine/threonine protein kinase [Chrysochromulina ericina virus CeV-01B]|uniref:non-specific serine/threonine protein kinase n=1 Tax=Chrysochromulina ericina virus CeV-01B TaxID=3070830 RepID=A0A0N9QZ24_9VIRU|nr:serine/threonine protein kinase [Chrysochromulina ericina virus]ALH23327.1 serine/threonine protein kinase [Chrysochromulina ericina virus CeV-01B]